MDLKQFNSSYGIPGQLDFIRGKGGMPVASVTNRSAKALISLYAGQILSFRPNNEPEDLLFLSQTAEYTQGKAIRGGIPLCWPWFGPDPEYTKRPNHGFARTHNWTVLDSQSGRYETQLTLGFSNSNDSTMFWPDDFALKLAIDIGSTLTLELETSNLSKRPFVITQAFHPYFRIGYIERVQVLGLEGCTYLDRLTEDNEIKQSGPLTFSEEVDRIYTDVEHAVIIDDAVLKRRIRIAQTGTRSTVVWNPWINKSATMSDLGVGDYKHFLCVEPGNFAPDSVDILPGCRHKMSARFSIERD